MKDGSLSLAWSRASRTLTRNIHGVWTLCLICRSTQWKMWEQLNTMRPKRIPGGHNTPNFEVCRLENSLTETMNG